MSNSTPIKTEKYTIETTPDVHSRFRRPGSAKSSIGRRTTPHRLDALTSAFKLTGTPTRKALESDRFIPARQSIAAAKLERISNENAEGAAYKSNVDGACGVKPGTKILAFRAAPPESSRPVDLRSQYNRPLRPVAAASRRKILTAPERVLDAPGLVDDYYLNLLDWSSANCIAVCLERAVYVWNADTGSVSQLTETAPDLSIAGLKWSNDGSYLSLGISDGTVQVWDPSVGSKLRTMGGHAARVGILSWNKHIISSGCKDGSIHNHDVRIAAHKVNELLGHDAEVAGLEWRADGSQLASGGNDNVVNIWDARSSVPKFTKTNHNAAVKAVAWCPWQNSLLATGGGSFDRKINFWNTTTGARVNTIDTGSQVTGIKWSTAYKELASTHGFPDNQISMWSYPSLDKIAEIPAHESRVLHSALSPDGQTLATAASDENLKFWKLFESSNTTKQNNSNNEISKQASIR